MTVYDGERAIGPNLLTLIDRRMSALSGHFSLFRYRKRIVHRDAEILDRALNLGVAEPLLRAFKPELFHHCPHFSRSE
jgi:hypothetical protein